VKTFGVNDLVEVVDSVNDAEVDKLIAQSAVSAYDLICRSPYDLTCRSVSAC
jgi:L-arabinose isomerase